ncbi:MAG: DNA topoisomerase [Clostridia bacterium 41_269]|nr:MAG: DNA topoisomerase [Clostridia bacterium 41_269]
MANILVIVESPTKAKTIKRFLGKGYTVKSSMGHVRDLPKSQLGVDVENNFEPKYVTIRGKGEILKNLRAEAQKSSKVLLGPDPDREGEAIAWHLKEILKLNDSKCRIEFNEITKNAILKAVKEPKEIDQRRVDAQQARRILDRLVGYNLSPFLWKKVKKGLSAGRVQSVAVKLILEREREIEDFKPEEYWSLTAQLTNGEDILEAKLVSKGNKKIHISSEGQINEILKDLKEKPFVVKTIKKKERKRKPLAPLITSTLQQEASKRYNFSAKKTMLIAQQLYEGIDLGGKDGIVGLITYIRTDSTRISDEALSSCRTYIADKFGKEYVPDKPNIFPSKKGAQEAHEAIRPTSVSRDPESIKTALTRDQFKIYSLIWERFISSQMKPAVFDVTEVEIAACDYLFKATGSILRFSGFLKVFSNDDFMEKEALLPELSEGEVLEVKKLEPKKHFTQPPPRYTEASLVKTLEDLGIGRPSTYAPIIDTILTRGYVVKEDKYFVPTELGAVVTDLLEKYFSDIIDVEFTAAMEENLDKIEEGKQEWRKVVEDFYRPFKEILKKAEEEVEKIDVGEEVTDKVCEKCGRNLVVKYGRYGKFLACPGYPECTNTKPFLEKVGVKCPECGGEIVVRRSKKGRKFYGCENFPKCEFISWHKLTEKNCPQCNSMLIEKETKKIKRVVCSNQSCQYEETLNNKDSNNTNAEKKEGEII